MITLYDLAFEEDRRPSPFCWRAKFSLAHKGLDYTDVPMGFTEKEKIAFADSRTVPVIKDGEKPVKDSWAIAVYLDDMYPEKLLLKSEMGRSYARFINGWADTVINAALFPLIVGDLYDRVRPEDKPYFAESPARGWARRTSPLSRPRPGEKGLARSARPSNRRAGPCASRSSCRAPKRPYPDYSSRRQLHVATHDQPRSSCLMPTIRSMLGASACLTCRRHGPQGRRRRDAGHVGHAGSIRHSIASGRRTGSRTFRSAEVLHQLADARPRRCSRPSNSRAATTIRSTTTGNTARRWAIGTCWPTGCRSRSRGAAGGGIFPHFVGEVAGRLPGAVLALPEAGLCRRTRSIRCWK